MISMVEAWLYEKGWLSVRVGRKVSRRKALELSRTILLRAERERIEDAERHARYINGFEAEDLPQ